MKRKNKAKKGSLPNPSTDIKNFFDFNIPIRKERLSPTSKTRREASQNKFVKKGGMPDRVENLREVNCGKNRLRPRLGFVKPI